jgi:hypothetical protein
LDEGKFGIDVFLFHVLMNIVEKWTKNHIAITQARQEKSFNVMRSTIPVQWQRLHYHIRNVANNPMTRPVKEPRKVSHLCQCKTKDIDWPVKVHLLHSSHYKRTHV